MSERICIGIDTGPIDSALVLLAKVNVLNNENNTVERQKILNKVYKPNKEIIEDLKQLSISDARYLAIEMFQGRGQIAGQSSYDSIFIAGIFANVWQERNPNKPILIYRSEVKQYLCGTIAANDSNVRQAIIDLFPATGGGACPQKGTKKQPGPLYGMARHHWSALAVALTAQSGEYGRCRTEF